jgi:lactoylglutathione lyase
MVVAQVRLSCRRPELSVAWPAETTMNLAKPSIDIGFATNAAPAALAFWQNEIGLPFDYTQPIRRSYKQHRHDLRGSILKINHVYEPLPDYPPSGYRELLIARDDVAVPQPMADLEGNRVALVPKGMFGIQRIGIRLCVRDVEGYRPLLYGGAWIAAGRTRGRRDDLSCWRHGAHRRAGHWLDRPNAASDLHGKV